MGFNFYDLDQATRELMLEEIASDAARKSLYISPRLSPEGAAAYQELLKANVSGGSEETLAAALGRRGMMNSHEERRTKNGTTMAAVPYNAHEVLAEGEFNRFYIRAVCRRAIELGQRITVYRAKEVTNARSASEAMIGQSLDPHQVLNDLRSNPGVDSAFGLPPGPNSGLSARL